MSKKNRRHRAGNDDKQHRQLKPTDRVAQQDRLEIALIKQGAIIHVEHRRTLDRDGRKHCGIAHHSLIKHRQSKEQ